MKKSNYPFVSLSVAKLAKKYGFDERCYAIYENGYKDNGKRIKAKFFEPHLTIKTTVYLLQNSEFYNEYLKRPGMFEGNGKLPIWCTPAPTYEQLFDWFRRKYNLFLEIAYSQSTYKIFICDQKKLINKEKTMGITSDFTFSYTEEKRILFGIFSDYYRAVEESPKILFEYLKEKCLN